MYSKEKTRKLNILIPPAECKNLLTVSKSVKEVIGFDKVRFIK